ncbi:MAG: hypothetical protein M1820_009729 [Bogoriella megaspora]|nr:MAG: hypothetical protein M1820_009729 [Bogoriella megaspora]
MLSLPLIPPQYTSPHLSHSSTNPTTANAPSNPPPATAPQRRPTFSPSYENHPPAPSSLILLTSDESALIQRKRNIRRFGAGWIRPPGVQKTFQQSMDEAQERLEHEAGLERERRAEELRGAQVAAENAERERNNLGEGGEGGDGQGGEWVEGERDLDADIPDAEVERDLDDEVPEAEEESMGFGESEEDEDEEDDDDAAEMGSPRGRHERGMVQRDVEMEDVEMEMEGEVEEERDLDDDVPEAGGYEHTDTELEDESEGEEPNSFVHLRAGARGVQWDRQAARSSMLQGGDSSGLESSLLASSPMGERGVGRGRRPAPRGRSPPD